MKNILRLKRIYLLLLYLISYALILLAKHNIYFAEQIYALHIYKWISQAVSSVTGIIPFSLAELLFFFCPVAALSILIWFAVRMIMIREERRSRLFKGILNLLCMVSVLLFIFVIFAGINYYRYPFSYYSKLEVRDSSLDELLQMTESLAIQAGELREKVPCTDEQGVFKLSMSHRELAELENKVYLQLAEDYPVLGGKYGNAKQVLLSSLMSYTEITGIFIPFTMEANVNVAVPDYTIPATMFHEMSHLRGFMREDEANFIAYLAGMKSDDVELQYSSTMLALIVSGNALYDKDKELYMQVRDLYTEGVLKDIRANTLYWQQFDQSVVSTISDKINDTYLKANAQTDGVQSYGRMVDLLLAKYRKDRK